MKSSNVLKEKLIKEIELEANKSKSIDILAPLRDQLHVQGENGNWNYDSYMHGMYNGLECALATLEHREPQYRSAPTEWLKDRSVGFVPTEARESTAEGALSAMKVIVDNFNPGYTQTEDLSSKSFTCPFKVNDKIFNNYDGVTAHVTELTERGFKYILTKPKSLVPRWGWMQEGGEVFLDLPWAPSYWELYTGENKIKPLEIKYNHEKITT